MLRECHLHHCIIRTYYNIYNTLQQESKWLHEAVKSGRSTGTGDLDRICGGQWDPGAEENHQRRA